MKFSSFILAVACSVPFLAFSADEVKELELNDGTIHKNCTLIEETDTYYIMAVPQKEGKSIKDEKKIMKSEVKRLVKPSAEEIDFKKLQRVFLDESAVNEKSAEEFNTAVDKFLKKYPNSENKAKIEAEKARNKDILDHLKAGDIKVDGKWVNKDVQARILYGLQAKKLLTLMKSRAAARDYRNALNCQEKLKKEFPASESTVKALELAPGLIQLYVKQLEPLRDNAKYQDDEKKKELAALRKKNPEAGNKAQTEYLQQQREKMSALSSKNHEERRAGYLWTSYDETDLASIERAMSYAETALQQIKVEAKDKKSNDSTLKSAEQEIADFWAAIDAGKLQDAKQKMSNVRQSRVAESYREPMEASLKALQEKVTAEEQAVREAREKARREAAEKLAAERKAAREKAEKLREENRKKAREAQEQRKKGKPGSAAPGEKPAAPASSPGQDLSDWK